LWLHSLKVAQLLRSAACLHTNQSRSYLNHLVVLAKHKIAPLMMVPTWTKKCRSKCHSFKSFNISTILYQCASVGTIKSIRTVGVVNAARSPLFSLSNTPLLQSPLSVYYRTLRSISVYFSRLWMFWMKLLTFCAIKKLKMPVAFYRSPSGG